MIEESGLIITTSLNLGSAPVADFLTAEGAIGQAWVSGRDDSADLALLQVINPNREYATIDTSISSPPQLDEDLAALFFLETTGATPNVRNARVIGAVQDLATGIRYFQIQAVEESGAEGGSLVGTDGKWRGLLMTETQMVTLGLGRTGEVWAMASDSLSTIILPRLQAGFLEINSSGPSSANGEDPGAPPPIPSIYHGTVSIGGALPARATRIYAHVIKGGRPNLWFSEPIDTNGKFVMPVGIIDAGYSNATVEFWIDAKRATQVAVYVPSVASLVDLTFP